jgi:hypothetical protein
MLSSSEPGFISALIVAVKAAVNSTPERFTVPNPSREKATSYTPGLSDKILYWPWPSVTAERVLSISTGLDTSTVTPGRTPSSAVFHDAGNRAEIALTDGDSGSSANTSAASRITLLIRSVLMLPPQTTTFEFPREWGARTHDEPERGRTVN